jgi:hypothetical protein
MPTPGQLSYTAAAIQGILDSVAAKAPLASPVFTGDPKATTPAVMDNDTSVATTAFVKSQSANTVASNFVRSVGANPNIAVGIPVTVTVTINGVVSTGSITKNAHGDILSSFGADSKANAATVFGRANITQAAGAAGTQTLTRTIQQVATDLTLVNVVQTRTITRNTANEILTISQWA